MLKQLEQILEKYTKGTASNQEKELIELWFDELQIGGLDKANVDNDALLYNRMYKNILKVFETPKHNNCFSFKSWYSTAVCILILLGTILFIFPTDKDSLMSVKKTAKGENTSFYLSDSTWVRLGENSVLSFPNQFSDNHRLVKLNGEAYFDVRKTKNKNSFIVVSSNLMTKVLGTRFTVNDSSYNSAFVEVESGKVLVQDILNSNTVVLNRGQKVNWNKSMGLSSVLGNEGKVPFFKTLHFDNTSLKEVVKILNEQSNLNFEIEQEWLSRLKIHGDLNVINIDEILKCFEFIWGIKSVKKEPNSIILYV